MDYIILSVITIIAIVAISTLWRKEEPTHEDKNQKS